MKENHVMDGQQAQTETGHYQKCENEALGGAKGGHYERKSQV